jgi:hypothetical protein
MGEVHEDWRFSPGEELFVQRRGELYAAKEKLDKRIARDGDQDNGHMARLRRDVELAQRNFDAAEKKFMEMQSVMGADGE